MEYELTIIVSLFIFLALDLIICINSIKNDNNSHAQRIFMGFAISVSAQQLFAIFTVLSNPGLNSIGNTFTYFAYEGALITMTIAAYYCYRYLRIIVYGDDESPRLLFTYMVPVAIIVVACLASPFTHGVFYVDEAGIYQRGSLFFLQMFCPYVYLVLSLVLGISQKRKGDPKKTKKMLRFFFVYLTPSMIGTFIQMFIVKGAYSAVGISMGFVLMYLQIYMEDINENKRLKAIEPLNAKLQNANEELSERMSVIQSMSRVYFVSLFADLSSGSYIDISNSDFVEKYVGSGGSIYDALEIFYNKLVEPQYSEELKRFVDLTTLDERMKSKQFITCDYEGRVAGWCQAYLIAGDRDEYGMLKTVFLAVRTIHDEKERELAQNRELVNARNAAEAASEAKTVFLSNMSHDIRTPLNAILGFSDLMEREKDNPQVVGKYLGKIKTSGEYLLSIINNVLDMARIESGKLTVDYSLMDLLAEADDIGSYFGDMVIASNHSFSIETSIEHRYVKFDIAKHKQIIMNLVGNAVKYTPENGSVKLRLVELPCDRAGYGTYKMTISDSGIGMSQEFLEHIFDSFSRERNTTDSKVIGTGLGMSIVKRLVDLLGGTIEVESELGKGSSFIISFDLEFADEAEISAEKKEEALHDAAVLKGRHILMAEDNELNAEITMAILEDEGMEVDHVENGRLCLERMTEAPAGFYDLILMDIQMPEMNGYEATKAIRQLDKGKEIPIVALSANAFEEDKAASANAGMNDHVGKPIDRSKLMSVIARLCKER